MQICRCHFIGDPARTHRFNLILTCWFYNFISGVCLLLYYFINASKVRPFLPFQMFQSNRCDRWKELLGAWRHCVRPLMTMAHHPLLTVMCSAICSRRKGQGRWMPKGVHLASDHARKRSEHRRHDRWTYEQSRNSGGCLRNPISAKRCAGPTPDAARTDQSVSDCRRRRSKYIPYYKRG